MPYDCDKRAKGVDLPDSHRNRELADAFLAWLGDVRKTVEPVLRKSNSIPEERTRPVIREEPGRTVFAEIPLPVSPDRFVWECREPLVRAESYQNAVSLLNRCPEAAQLSGRYVGTSAGKTKIDWERLPFMFVSEYWLESRSLEFDDRTFNSVYAAVERLIYNDRLERILTARLHNFDSEADALIFDEELSAELITPALYEYLYLRGGTFRTENKQELRGTRTWLLTSRTFETKRVENEGESMAVDEFALHKPYRRMEELVKALRIYKTGTPFFRSVDERTPWAYHGGRVFPSNTIPKKDDLVLRVDELDEFKRLLGTIRGINLNEDRFMRVAIERFSNALDRQAPEDCLIDLCICLEALLLNGVGNEEDRGNISYRFALHGARLVADDFAGREAAFQTLKDLASSGEFVGD